MSISGDTIVVGARGNDDNGSNSGSAYVFAGGSTTTTIGSISTVDLCLKPAEEANIDTVEGKMYFDSTTKKVRYYDGTQWQDLAIV